MCFWPGFDQVCCWDMTKTSAAVGARCCFTNALIPSLSLICHRRRGAASTAKRVARPTSRGGGGHTKWTTKILTTYKQRPLAPVLHSRNTPESISSGLLLFLTS